MRWVTTCRVRGTQTQARPPPRATLLDPILLYGLHTYFANAAPKLTVAVEQTQRVCTRSFVELVGNLFLQNLPQDSADLLRIPASPTIQNEQDVVLAEDIGAILGVEDGLHR